MSHNFPDAKDAAPGGRVCVCDGEFCLNEECVREKTRSKLTVQPAWKRVMLKAPEGTGRSRCVSILELESFITQARAEAMAHNIPRERYEEWAALRNVHLMDSQLYVDTPWGETREC